MRRFLILAVCFAICPAILSAQGRGMRSAAAPAPAMAPRVVARASQPIAPHMVAGTRVVISAGTPRTRLLIPVPRTTRRPSNFPPRNHIQQSVFTEDFTPVPGLGFDFPHLAATQGARAVGARRHSRAVGTFVPFFDGGFFLPTSPIVIEEAAAAESSQAENSEPEPVPTVRRARASESSAVYSPEVAPATQHEAEEYVFVRRDGTVFFAVAYAWENDTLRYITREGLRRNVARDALDMGATQQFNEQRGLNFRSPA